MVSDTAYIPTIDIAPFLADPESEAAAVIVEEMRHACTHSGFFSIVGHGVPRELQDRVLAAAKALFGLPLAEKESLRPKKPLSNRGYEVMGQQVLQPGTLPDFREGFYISKHVPASDPRCAANPAFVGENIFPTTLPDDVVKEPCEAYYDIVFDLACKVLRIIAKGMPYGDDVFDEFVSDIPICTMRLLHYPPQRSNDARQLGAGAHTDFGAITLLLQDSAGGLEVLDQRDPTKASRWIAVEPNPDAYVVNIGDMLSVWTKGQYKSTVHRVVNKTTRDRCSVPFFFDGKADVRLLPLDGSDPLPGKENLTVLGHMLERFETTYRTNMKHEPTTAPAEVEAV